MDGAKDIPYVDAAFDVNLDAPDIEINYQLTCRFFFENDVDPPAPAEATEFMRDYGVSYALGYVNAALASDSSAFRVRNYAIPVLALNDVKSLVTSNESDTDTPG
ncbi:hypothetical protein DFR74_103119 [Nocardia puris]|uniref:Uncharacterized protein n=2 Tax=Nocardia puris TaxID=208602 RepID=A0A366DQU9_9NOCA|nr:hypothetical protein DFR74_103119 [Nocardia puris]